MIRVQLYLDSAITRKRSSLGGVEIWNTGTGTKTRGNYGYRILSRDGRAIKDGAIYDWPRTSKTAMALLQRVINDAYPSKT